MRYIFNDEYDSQYRIGDKEVACFSRKEMKRRHPDGNYTVLGETRPNNRKKELDTVPLGGRELRLSETDGHSRLLFRRVGYVLESGGSYIALLRLRWLLLLLLFLLLIGAVSVPLLLRSPGEAPGVAPPDMEIVAAVTETDRVYISLPFGTVRYRIANDLSAYEGADVEIYISVEGKEYLVHRQTLHFTESGEAEEGSIDFPSLRFELLSGDYKGRIVCRMQYLASTP